MSKTASNMQKNLDCKNLKLNTNLKKQKNTESAFI